MQTSATDEQGRVAGPSDAAAGTGTPVTRDADRESGRDTAAAGGSPDAPDPRRWEALTVALVVGFMTLLDVSIVNVALPSIRTGLGASASDLQWVLSGYALTFGLVLVPAGRLGDARGRRSLFIAGLVLFTVVSAAAGFAQSPAWLTGARFLQGAAAGLLNPQVAGLIQQLFRGAERGKAFGLLGATIGISTAIGPVLGGALIRLAGTQQGWRWIFFVNVPVGLLALPLAYRLIPARGAEHKHRESFDPVGVLLLGLGVVLLLLPFVEEQQWHGGLTWLLVPAAAVVLAGFVGWERRYRARGGQPVADLGLFRVRSYSLGSALALVYFAGFTAVFFIYTLYLQSGLGYSALLAGAAITPFALGSAGAAAIGGRTVSRFGRPLVAVGLVLVVLGLGATDLAVHLLPGRGAPWAAAGPLLVAGIGSGLVISPNQTLTLSEVPSRGGGSAAGVLQTGQRVGTAVGIAAVGSIFFSAIARTHGQWAHAFTDGLHVVIAFVAAALVVALVDLLWRRAPEHRPQHAAR